MPNLTTTNTLFALQGVQTAFLVLLLLMFYLRMRRDQYLLWWSLSWMSFSVYLLSGLFAIRAGTGESAAKEAVVLTSVVAGLLQVCFLCFVAWTLPRHAEPRRVLWWPWVASVVVLSALVFSLSKVLGRPDDYLVRLLFRSTLLGLAYGYCGLEFYRWWRNSRSQGARLTAYACSFYGVSQLIFAGDIVTSLMKVPLQLGMLSMPVDSAALAGIGLGVVLLLLDEHRATERARMESEARFGGVAESLAEGVLITSPEDRILYVNKSFLRLVGYQRREVIGQPAYRLLHKPEQWESLWQKNRERLGGQSDRYEIEVHRKGGSSFTAEVSAAPYRDSAGEVLGILNVVTDITERRAAEQALRASEDRYRMVAQTASDAILTIDQDSRILFANPAAERMFGYRVSELLGTDLTRLMPDYLRVVHKTAVARYLETGKRHISWDGVSLPGLHKKGHEILLEVSFSELQKDGRHFFTGIIRDVTERKQSEALQNAVYKIAEAPSRCATLDELYAAVHQIVQEVMPAGNFYIALYDEKEDLISFPYFKDEEDRADPPRKPRRGNTEYVLRTGRSLLSTVAVHEEMTRRGEVELIGHMSPVWLGVPLKVGDKAIGVMAVQHYREANAYGEREQRMLEFVSTQVAKAIAWKQAEEALRQSEEKFARAFRSSPDAMVLSRLSDSTFLEVNEGFLQLSGFTREEVIGKSALNLKMWSRPETREEIARALREHGSVHNIEAEFLDKQGQPHIGLVSAELMDFGGEPAMLVVTRDITRRKEMEEAVRRSEEKFSKAFHASPDAMVISSMAESRFLEINQSFLRLTSYGREEVIGRTSNDLNLWVDPEHRVRVSHAVRDAGVLRNEEFQLRTKSGEVLICLLSVDLVELAGQQCFLNVIRDITDRKQMEEALRYSEERYRELFENANDIVYTHDLAGNFTSLNRAGERLTGYSADEARRLNITTILSAEQARFAQSMMQMKLEGKGPTTYELDIHRKDGSALTLEVSTRLIYHEGEPVAIQGIARDITERKRAEGERLRFLRIQTALGQASRAFLSTLDPEELLDQILEVALRSVPTAQKGAFLNWDEREDSLQVRRTRGYSDPRVSQARLVRAGYSYRAAKAREPLIVEDAYANPETRYEGDVEEMRAIRSGLAVPLIVRERMLGIISVDADTPRAFDEEDKELLLAVAGHAALALENALLYEQAETSRENYRIVSDLVSDWAYSMRVEPDGSTVDEWMTEAFSRVTGYPREEFVAHGGWPAIVHADDRETLKVRREKLLRGEVDVSEVRIVTRDGDIRWIRDHGRPEWDAARKRVVRIYGAAQDITERRTLEDQLRQAQKMEAVGRLAGGVAHDFNNLLMVIRGYTELMMEQLTPDSPMRRSASQIEKASDRAAALTQQLLAFSRKQVLALQTLNLNTVLAGVDKMLGRVIGEDIELVVRPGGDLGFVKADPGQMEQVILNLAVNARDAMPNGGNITLETANVEMDEAFVRVNRGAIPGRYILLTVTDTGLGMDAETQARAFEPFFTTKEKGKGTGLGLATVYGIVKQSNGYITIESEPGHGACIRTYLPRVEAQVEAAAEPHAAPAVHRGKETVLVVEDQEDVRDLALEFLRSQGYSVLHASNGVEALEVAGRHRGSIHLLMTDVIMPGINGRELAQRLTAARPETRVLYVSGYTEEAIGQHGVLEPGTEFLAKPFSRDALARKLREILDNVAPGVNR